MSISESFIHIALPDLLISIFGRDYIQTLSLTLRKPDGQVVLLLWRKDDGARVELMLEDSFSDLETLNAAPLNVFPFVDSIEKINAHLDRFPDANLPATIIDLLRTLKGDSK